MSATIHDLYKTLTNFKRRSTVRAVYLDIIYTGGIPS